MPIYIPTPPEVYELTEGWSFRSQFGQCSGTRTYIETTSTFGGSTTKVPLPKLGDIWDSTYQNLTCKSIDTTLVNNNETCGKKHVLNYDSLPVIQTDVPIGKDDLPRNVTIGGELVSWEPKNSTWKWWFTGNDVKQPIFFQISTATIRVTRIIKELSTYLNTVFTYINYTNDDVMWGFPAGALLFTGADCTEFRNRAGNKRWRVDLNFVARRIIGSTAELPPGLDWGWNTILDEDSGKWGVPEDNAGNRLYLSASLDTLFTVDALGPDELLYTEIPDE